MSSPYLQTDLKKETKKFAAFDKLTKALTRIDKYESSSKKKPADKELLKEAAEFISEALKADENYFKARYFQAVVSYLQGENADAKKNFAHLCRAKSATDEEKAESTINYEKAELSEEVKNEIQYNIAVVSSRRGYLNTAISRFERLIPVIVDPETKLLARAGLAWNCRRRINENTSYKPKEGQKSDLEIIEEQYLEIQETLAKEEESLITDEVITEVEGIMTKACDHDVRLRRPGRGRRLPGLSSRLQLLILIIIGSIILVLIIQWLYLYLGLNMSSVLK